MSGREGRKHEEERNSEEVAVKSSWKYGGEDLKQRRFNHHSFWCLRLNISQGVRREFYFWLSLILKHRAYNTVQLTGGEESMYETALWKCEELFPPHEKINTEKWEWRKKVEMETLNLQPQASHNNAVLGGWGTDKIRIWLGAEPNPQGKNMVRLRV